MVTITTPAPPESEVGLLEVDEKVPLLGDIPLVGYLFRSTGADVSRQNLMVFIHPTILRDAAVTERHTNSKYNSIRSIQLGQDEDGVNLMPGKRHPVLPTIEEFSGTPAPVQVVEEVTVAEPETTESTDTTSDYFEFYD